jgi:hypothetical protein
MGQRRTGFRGADISGGFYLGGVGEEGEEVMAGVFRFEQIASECDFTS